MLSNPFDKASRYIRSHGWAKHTYGVEGQAVCLVGAVNLATGQLLFESRKNRKERGYLYRAITAYQLHRPSGVVRWNDQAKTTEDDVLAVLQYAAKEWDRDHDPV